MLKHGHFLYQKEGNPMKYVGYTRVSTKRQGKSGLGLEAQEATIKHFYPETSVWFCDVKSGKNLTERPELHKAIRYCIEHNATLVVAKVDRLSRKVEDGLMVLSELNGRLKFCDIPGDTDKFMLTLFLAVAERERELIRIRIKVALDAKKARGESWNKDRTVTREAVREASRVRSERAASKDNNIRAMIFAQSLREHGKTFDEIATTLNDNQYQSPTGGKWNKGSVYRLIR